MRARLSDGPRAAQLGVDDAVKAVARLLSPLPIPAKRYRILPFLRGEQLRRRMQVVLADRRQGKPNRAGS